MGKLSFATLLFVLLTGCQAITPQQCTVADWYQLGHQDGAKGKESHYISNYVKPCSKVNIIPNSSLWHKGREEGLKKYCTVETAYLEGLNGNKLNHVCPANSQNRVIAWEKGYNIFSLKQAYKKAESDYNSSLNLYEKSSGKTQAERSSYLIKMENAKNKMDEISYDLRRLSESHY